MHKRRVFEMVKKSLNRVVDETEKPVIVVKRVFDAPLEQARGRFGDGEAKNGREFTKKL
jgi:hypothetical protein